jgi:uncharacterized protein YraI
MNWIFPRGTLALVITGGVLLLGALLAAAQEDSAPGVQPDASGCAVALEMFYVTASKACVGGPVGYICNGGSAPRAEPAGPVSNSLASLGAMVPVDVVEALELEPLHPDGSGGLVWMRVPETEISAVMIGHVSVRNLPVEGFPAWQSFLVETGANNTQECPAAPPSVFVVQNLVPMQPARVVINGVSLSIAGTALVQTQDSDTVFVVLDGQLRVNAGGQIQNLMAGQQVRTSHNPDDRLQLTGGPDAPVPFEDALVANFPIALIDRPATLPQPGTVGTDGAVNLRSSPSIHAGLITQVPAGQTMAVLGRSPDGEWYHVRLPSGQTGWMFAELLRRNHGPIAAVYEATPAPPQRYGEIGQLARVQAPAGVNLRSAPDPGFGAIHALPSATEVQLIARSPYSPWVKIEAEGVVGWVALISLETQAIIESLPIDFDVPPPPEPTLVPGSWGGAFPDPDCYPNCD